MERLRLGLLRLVWGRRWPALDLARVVRRFDTPERISDYMQVAFRYTSDSELFGVEELWQTPADTFENKAGDCEDFALFAWFVLRLHGVPAHLFAAFTARRGHAVCAYEEHGRLHTICNEGLARRAVPRQHARPRPGDQAARRLADSIFPNRWTSCSFVHRLRFTPPEPGKPRQLLPEYRFLHVDGT